RAQLQDHLLGDLRLLVRLRHVVARQGEVPRAALVAVTPRAAALEDLAERLVGERGRRRAGGDRVEGGLRHPRQGGGRRGGGRGAGDQGGSSEIERGRSTRITL